MCAIFLFQPSQLTTGRLASHSNITTVTLLFASFARMTTPTLPIRLVLSILKSSLPRQTITSTYTPHATLVFAPRLRHSASLSTARSPFSHFIVPPSYTSPYTSCLTLLRAALLYVARARTARRLIPSHSLLCFSLLIVPSVLVSLTLPCERQSSHGADRSCESDRIYHI